jgi:hypothetical protein
MPDHIPGRGPYLVNGQGGQAVSTTVHMTRTRKGSEPEVTVTDPKTKKAKKIPRKTYAVTVRSPK